MKEIRVCWAAHVVHHDDEVRKGGLWTPATPEFRRDMETIVEVGNEVYGAGTHWIEERQA